MRTRVPPAGLLLPLLLLLLRPPRSQPGFSCGHYHPFQKIIGGSNALPNRWPWQVSLQINGMHLCGGSLIAQEWVMTAAHCVFWDYDYSVRLGDIYISDTETSVVISVKDILIHPDFSEMRFLRGDVALVRLESPVQYSQSIQPICLPSDKLNFKNGTRCWVTGWGKTIEKSDHSHPFLLQEAEQFILEEKTCNKKLKKALFIPQFIPLINKRMICAFHPKGKDACQGDSGGPLACELGQHTWVQAGIISWGVGCGKFGVPGVYTRVSSFSKWIIKYTSQSSSSLLSPSYLTFFLKLLLMPLPVLATL